MKYVKPWLHPRQSMQRGIRLLETGYARPQSLSCPLRSSHEIVRFLPAPCYSLSLLSVCLYLLLCLSLCTLRFERRLYETSTTRTSNRKKKMGRLIGESTENRKKETKNKQYAMISHEDIYIKKRKKKLKNAAVGMRGMSCFGCVGDKTFSNP